MQKKLICIECPQGCELLAELKNGQMITVTGNTCPKGENYARSEIENPVRILTTSVLAEGLDRSMISIKSTTPIPKPQIMKAMQTIKKIKITHPVKVGDTIQKKLLNLDIDLIATRSALYEGEENERG
jgi:CxxC motif-containing protein